jgi:hypothetical protein
MKIWLGTVLNGFICMRSARPFLYKEITKIGEKADEREIVSENFKTRKEFSRCFCAKEYHVKVQKKKAHSR